MGVKENSAQWLDLAYDDWLDWLRSDKKKSYLRESTRNIVERMKVAAEAFERKEEAWNILGRLKRLANNFNNLDDVSSIEEYMYEPSEIFIECALVAYQMDDLQEALALLKIPINGFPPRSLHKAISYWMQGCMQWQSQSHLEDALVSWEKSIQITRDVKSDKANDAGYARKCSDILEQMTHAIREASKTNSPPPAPTKKSAPKTNVKARPAKLRLYPIYGPIPAGPPAWVPGEPQGYSEISSIILNDAQYEIFSLRGELTVHLHGGRTYFLLQANGDSMNMANPVRIERGNYVLMAKQDAAESGDIVAAEIVREDTAATLKRYRFKDGRHRLEPETDDPALAGYISVTKDFYIRGVALAVLKPQ